MNLSFSSGFIEFLIMALAEDKEIKMHYLSQSDRLHDLLSSKAKSGFNLENFYSNLNQVENLPIVYQDIYSKKTRYIPHPLFPNIKALYEEPSKKKLQEFIQVNNQRVLDILEDLRVLFPKHSTPLTDWIEENHIFNNGIQLDKSLNNPSLFESYEQNGAIKPLEKLEEIENLVGQLHEAYPNRIGIDRLNLFLNTIKGIIALENSGLLTEKNGFYDIKIIYQTLSVNIHLFIEKLLIMFTDSLPTKHHNIDELIKEKLGEIFFDRLDKNAQSFLESHDEKLYHLRYRQDSKTMENRVLTGIQLISNWLIESLIPAFDITKALLAYEAQPSS